MEFETEENRQGSVPGDAVGSWWAPGLVGSRLRDQQDKAVEAGVSGPEGDALPMSGGQNRRRRSRAGLLENKHLRVWGGANARGNARKIT